MQRLLIAGAVAALVASVAVTAQSQAPDAKDKKVMLTGCLAKGDDPGTFVLNNATMAGEKVGTTGEAAKPAAGKSYHIAPGTVAKMEAHVGHQVEITGTLDPMAKDKPAAAPAAKDKPAMAHVTATAMKHVAAKCM
jgi:hypothetical protein